jgi:hypothetical protein
LYINDVGAVLVDLLKSYLNLQVTALVRNPAHVEPVSELGVKVVLTPKAASVTPTLSLPTPVQRTSLSI